MAVIRLDALDALAQAIACGVPALSGAICVGQADPSHELAFPSLAIKPIRWTYSPHQAEEHFDPAPDRVVMDVGYWEGDVQLILGAKTAFRRYELEQQVIDLFLSKPLAPGVLDTPVLACRDKLGEYIASWELESDSWEDNAAFDQEFFSTIIVTGVLPALVTRKGSYTIEQLQLGLTEELGLAADPATFNTLPEIEVVQVQSDGSIQPVP